MGLTVKELLDRIDSRELTEWMAYFQIQPFGAIRGDLQAGQIAAQIINVNKKKNAKRAVPEDFILFHDGEKPTQSEDDMKAQLTPMARVK